MIAHCVFLNLSEDADTRELRDVMQGLADLKGEVTGFAGFTAGPNLDFETKSPDFPWGFICYFETEASLKSYAANPTHKALGARLCDLCEGGANGIVVFDLEVGT